MLCAWALCLQQLDDFDPQFLTLLDALAEHLPAKIRESEGLQAVVQYENIVQTYINILYIIPTASFCRALCLQNEAVGMIYSIRNFHD